MSEVAVFREVTTSGKAHERIDDDRCDRAGAARDRGACSTRTTEQRIVILPFGAFCMRGRFGRLPLDVSLSSFSHGTPQP